MKFELYKGDCLELMKGIPDKSVDMILCDPPYGTTSRNAWDKVMDIPKMWEQYKRIVKTGGAILLFAQPPFSTDLINCNRKWFRYEWVWEKSIPVGFLNANRMPLRAHEDILVFYEKLPTYNPQMGEGKPYKGRVHKSTTNYGTFKETAGPDNTGMRYPRDVIKFASADRSSGRCIHPTQKPVPLLEYMVKTYTREGEVVLDSCMGSGSTGVACANTGRGFIGMELNDYYFEQAQERIEKAAQK